MPFPKFLRVVVEEDFETDSENETERKFDPVCEKFVYLLSETLGFQYILHIPADGEYGSPLPNGNWTGMVGMVLRGETDLVVGELAMTYERSKVVSFSYPNYYDDVTFAVRKPTYIPELTKFFQPFSIYVWISVVTCFTIVSFMYYVLTSRKYSLEKTFLEFYSILLRNSSMIPLNKFSEYILVAFWMIGTMFLSNSYSAVLHSYLAFPPMVGVSNAKELAAEVRKGTYQCFTYAGGFEAQAMIASSEPDMQIIGNNILKHKGSSDVQSVLEDTSEYQPAFIGERRDLNIFKEKYYVSKDSFFLHVDAVAVKKSFCCMAELDKAISNIWAAGLYSKIVSDEAFLESLQRNLFSSDDSTEYFERKLSLTDMKGPFVLLISGYITAMFVLVLEIVFSDFRY